MKTVFKVVGIIVIAVLALIGGCTLMLGYGIKNGIGHMVDKAMDTGTQSVIVTSEAMIIKKTLTASEVFVLHGIDNKCDSEEKNFPEVDGGFSCFNGECKIKFQTTPVPNSVTIWRKIGNDCVQEKIDNLKQYRVEEYEGQISITPEMLKQLNIQEDSKNEVEKTANSKFNGISKLSISDKSAITLNYGGKAPNQDEILFGKKLIRIEYTNN